ncbi:MAG: 4Fe-4S binding protein [Planctomycetota bacterium]|nr:4Fe-4S binding protein [Planctomycetota bacterium]
METAVQEGRTRRRLRLAVRCLALAAAVALAWPFLPGASPTVVLPAVSPYVGMLSVLALRSLTVLSLVCLPTLLLCLFSPRWFCRYACPVGLLQELLGRLHPSAAARWRRLPSLGQWALLLAFGGACLGYPFLLWLDPLAMAGAFVSALRQPLCAATVVAGLGLPLVLLLAFLLPNAWCLRLCPLGATQELLAAVRSSLRRQPADGSATQADVSALPPRRAVLGAGLGALVALGLRKLVARSRPLRPPGAAGEQTFTGLCVRCGNCARACPAKIIHHDMGASGVAGFMAPVVRFENDYCREDCNACGQVCPSGAVARLSLARKRACVMGLATVDLDTCLMANGRDCSACITQCPYDAVARQDADDGFSSFPIVDRRKCTGCGACEVACPVRPLRAVVVHREPATTAAGRTLSPAPLSLAP